jgi:DNA primase
MHDSAKYLIHADVGADGVVERSDVVGAVFGQTEGLLGDEMDLRHLQESSKVGRIDVAIDSEGGRSFGTITIASSLDKVETAVLAASLETIERVGPCRADVEVTGIEDVRAAKRRDVVERATELLGEFDEDVMTTQELLAEVRRGVRVADITKYEGLPAGPNVASSDAVVVVEGRADVQQLLGVGIKNAVAVEGTDVPDAVGELTEERTVTAFLDGDRGGDLILRELAQVGDIDYVALAPPGHSVEDMDRTEVLTALREKVPYEAVAEGEVTVPPRRDAPDGDGDHATDATAGTDGGAVVADVADASGEETPATAAEGEPVDDGTDDQRAGEGPATLRDHVAAVVGDETGTARLLDGEYGVLAEVPAGDAFDAVERAETTPAAVVLDGRLEQRVLDVVAQRGVDQVVAAELGDFVKRPTAVRLRTAEQLLAS